MRTTISKEFRKNEQITAPEVLLIDHEGTQHGVVPVGSAMKIAQEAGLDLVEVSPQANPPVCKVVDFGRLKYEKEKQLKQNKARSKRAGETKGIRLSVKIAQGDLMTRVKAGQKFLDKGYKIKPELQLRGREKAHPELAKEMIEKFIELLERPVNIEQPVKRQGSRFSAVVSNKKK